MRRLLAWLLSFWPHDPNLDRRADWEPRTVSEPACIMCPRPALQDGLCGEHGGLPWNHWPAENQAPRLIADIEGES